MSWDERIARARSLAEVASPATAILTFYADLARYQQTMAGSMRPPDLLAAVDPASAALPAFLEWLQDHAPLAEHKGVDLGMTTQVAGAVNANADALRILFGNLLSNALQYSPSDSAVDVAMRMEGDELVVTVEDRGPGIPEQDLERVFDRFHRAANVLPSQPGSGLGLAIVRQIADLHGALVRLENTGTGLRVEVRFTKAKV